MTKILEKPNSSKDLVLIAAQAAFDKKALDIVVQEVKEQMVITDYFLIVTGMTNRQVDAISDGVEDALRIEAGVRPLGREGREDLSWVLLDYGDFVVHIFQPEPRAFYRLEMIWNDVPRLDLTAYGIVQEPTTAPLSS